MNSYQNLLKEIKSLSGDLFHKDFLLTWEKSVDELRKIVAVADALQGLRRANISTRCFDTGLAVSIFRDQSTRTRFSFFSAANLLGLGVQDLDEGRSQIAHGETVRETANMIGFFTEFIGIRDDIFLGAGHTYMQEVAAAVEDGFMAGVLEQRPYLVNLQSDIDHPTQSMADLMQLKNHFGSLEQLRGKKIAMTWAYSPSYGKPLSVPQGVIGLMTRFGMNVVLAHPEGYQLIPEWSKKPERSPRKRRQFYGRELHGRSLCGRRRGLPQKLGALPCHGKAHRAATQRRHRRSQGSREGLPGQNARFKAWECTEAKMKLTRKGQALYMHCLPADISGVSCAPGEVAASVFERYRIPTYIQAGFKPYIIAAVMLTSRFEDPVRLLRAMKQRASGRTGL